MAHTNFNLSTYAEVLNKMDLQEMGRGGMDWIKLIQNRDRCECGNEPWGSI